MLFPVGPSDSPAYRASIGALNDRLISRTLEKGGTCTGEHGVGVGKMGFLKDQYGEQVVGIMRQIKQVFDPNGVMNPGKIF